MTNEEIIKLYNTLEYLNSDTNLKFSIKIGYAFAKNLEILKPEVKIISDLRHQIIKDFGIPGDNGDIIIPKERLDEFNEKIHELMGMENNTKVYLVPIEAFDEFTDKLSLKDINGLSVMITV